MKNFYAVIIFFISISLFSQDEKKLALVIGNANYNKGELKNPVNDARLIASTLDSLGFDVILKENLENRTDFIRSVREFGNKRSEYDVAFVYYAGHGIQVDDENFLLPTKEEFSSQDDVLDFGVSVQNIMRYLRAQTNEVNILILDACRDNPFESKWNKTRSLKGGGLAKIPPPTGSLIAFSTDSGQTAPDGDGNNSTYTVSLANNMLLEDTSIDQVFRNVRSEVLARTDGVQRPVEFTQLTGQTFFLKPSNYYKIGKEFFNKGKYEEALNSYQNALNYDTNLINDYFFLFNCAIIYYNLGSDDKALEYLNLAIAVDSSVSNAYIQKAAILYYQKNYDKALGTFNTAISFNPNYAELYLERATIYHRAFNDIDNALKDMKKAYELDSENQEYLLNMAVFQQMSEKYEDALQNYLEYLKYNPPNSGAIYANIAMLSEELEDYKKALIYIKKSIDFNGETFRNLAIQGSIYEKLEKQTKDKSLNYHERALNNYNKAIELLNVEFKDQIDNNFKDEANRLNLLKVYLAIYQARIHFFIERNEYELAFEDINNNLKIEDSNPDSYLKLFYLFNKQKKYFDAYIHINKTIEILKNDNFFDIYDLDENKLTLLDAYLLRADISKKINNYSGLCEDYNKALNLSENGSDIYFDIEELISDNCN